MIEKNLGNIERVIRLLAGILLFSWALTRPTLNGTEWFVMLISMALILNGVFQRCYLWYVLDINAASIHENKPATDPYCQG
jgi:hypothetical protein